MFLRSSLIAFGLLTGLALAGQAAPSQPLPIGTEALYRLDLLPRFRESVKVGMVSSHDRTGGNDDGFSGRYSFVRKEGDNALVIADLKGPGCIYRIWTPTPTDDPVEFYFDGEAEPRLRIPFRKLFNGTQAPFLGPVAGYGSGGFWSYVPLPYRQSCKVVVRAPRVQFYQINYATYPDSAGVTTFSPGSPAYGEQLEKARRFFGAAGGDVTAYGLPEGAQSKTTSARVQLAPGRTAKLFETKKGGRVLGLRVSPASAFAGKARDTLLRITWDGEKEPAVLVPAGDFFGYSWGDPAARSLLVGSDGTTCYAYFPMPFDRSAKVELVSERTSGPAVEIAAEVVHTEVPRRPDEGRFYAVWRRENPTTDGQPFTFVNTQGRGHVVGVALQSQGMTSGNTYFFEGDDQATIDGELVAHGTGSEDFFNGGWYDVPGRWEHRASYPLTGCLDYKKALARTGAYRIFLTDAYPFRKSMLLTIEHAPEKNALACDYAGVTYLYAAERPTMPVAVPPVSQRMVQDLQRLVYVPGWNLPIYAFSLKNATLSKREDRVGEGNVRYFSMRAEGEEVFGQHLIAFLCEVPAAGNYRVSIEPLQGPEQGIIQLFRDEAAVGEAADLYAAERRKGPVIPMGTLSMKEGENQVFFKLVGKNPDSKSLGLDLVTLQLERVP